MFIWLQCWAEILNFRWFSLVTIMETLEFVMLLKSVLARKPMIGEFVSVDVIWYLCLSSASFSTVVTPRGELMSSSFS